MLSRPSGFCEVRSPSDPRTKVPVVTVWAIESESVQVTLVPALTVSFIGVNDSNVVVTVVPLSCCVFVPAVGARVDPQAERTVSATRTAPAAMLRLLLVFTPAGSEQPPTRIGAGPAR